MKQKETIIYGGAFNPPTRAHQTILQVCADRAGQSDADVWLLPSGERRDKCIDANRERRLQLCAALCLDIVTTGETLLRVEEQELDRIKPTETIDTVRQLGEAYPDRQFTWVFGSDSLQTMPQWEDGAWMLENLSMAIVERPGYPALQLGRRAVRLNVDPLDVSSTQVRQRLAECRPIEDLVSRSVAELLNADS